MKNLFNKGIKLHFSRQGFFSILAVVLIIIIVGLVIYLSTFLISNFGTALELGGEGVPKEQFDIKGFETLNLVKPQ
ncbi:MAG: hypothetical protein WCV80_01175 [Candidatus Paceibacterota bacterium]|jgi:hypothetical protein